MDSDAPLNIPTLTFGERLQKARRSASISKDAMATYLHVTERTVRRWETEQNEPPFSVVVRWADICHVPLEWIADAVDAGGRRFAQRKHPIPGQLGLSFDEPETPAVAGISVGSVVDSLELAGAPTHTRSRAA